MFKLIYQVTGKIKDKISKLNEKGQGMVEYAIILAVVAAIAITVFGTGDTKNGLGNTLNNAFSKADSQIDKAGGGSS